MFHISNRDSKASETLEVEKSYFGMWDKHAESIWKRLECVMYVQKE